MKSTYGINAGNINLKGKKYKILSCQCCVAQDFREKYSKKVAEKEIKNEIHSM